MPTSGGTTHCGSYRTGRAGDLSWELWSNNYSGSACITYTEADGLADPYVLGEACNTAMTYGYDSVTQMQETKCTLCRIYKA